VGGQELTQELLERERELEALEGALADAAQGDGRMVVVEAEAGLGFQFGCRQTLGAIGFNDNVPAP
jgi:hypothetical protein